jgi:uracil-DNA glycosylase
MYESWIIDTGIDVHKIQTFVNNEREKFSGVLEIYPKTENIFRCFSYFSIENVNVVIIGQDPYHGVDQANGLAFAVNEGIKKPPSLKNIEKELSKEVDIEKWAKQGVLMMNSALTVRQSSPGDKTHMKFWRPFTEKIIKKINDECEGVVFVAWGAFAMDFLRNIDMSRHHLVVTSHPSPLSANKKLKQYPAFIGSRVFETINEKSKKKIEW